MIQRQLSQVVITTSKGRVVVTRKLYDRLEAKLKPDELGLLCCFEWWRQLSELVNGISFATPGGQGREHT